MSRRNATADHKHVCMKDVNSQPFVKHILQLDVNRQHPILVLQPPWNLCSQSAAELLVSSVEGLDAAEDALLYEDRNFKVKPHQINTKDMHETQRGVLLWRVR